MPLASVRAIIEITRSLNDKANFTTQLKERENLLPNPNATGVIGVVVSHPRGLFDQECAPDWPKEHHVGDPPMTRLLDTKKKPDTNGIMAFIYFLSYIAQHGATSPR